MPKPPLPPDAPAITAPSAAAAAAAATTTTVSMYEQQIKIYPRSVTGRFARWRWVMVGLTQAVFYGVPWLIWNDRQAVLFDLGERRFQVLGMVLQPQDFIYLAALLVISALALFFFTAVAGRLWCGYACPQTVYTEIFLWIERRIEGDRVARMRLDAAPWSLAKAGRKVAKHGAWGAVALFTGFSFVGYFTPIRSLATEAITLAFSPWEWFWVLFYGLATYGNAGFLREQVCKYMCPYARFQGALIDGDSLVIAYDTGRGEPRGSRPRKAEPALLGLGSCIDCTLCVQVCPTGIDIRDGLQNECIGCAACIDVCDDVMGKMGYAPGLIRYATENGVAGGWNLAQMLRRVWRPRVLIYGALLLATSTAFVASLAQRSSFQVVVIKDRGALARTVDDGVIENVYRLQLTNNLEHAQRLHLRVSGPAGLRLATGGPGNHDDGLTVAAAGLAQWVVRVHLPAAAAQPLRGTAVSVMFEVDGEPADRPAAQGPTANSASNPSETVRERSTFFVPLNP